MRNRFTLAATCGAFTIAGIAAGGAAHAEEFTCTGSLGAVSVDNLRVPDGARCVLNGTQLNGSIVVGSGATLIADNVAINSNVQAENHRLVVVRTSQVGGSIQLVQGGDPGLRSAALRSNQVKGDVQLFSNEGSQVVSANTIDGNLQCKENLAAPTAPNTVGGNKEDPCAAL